MRTVIILVACLCCACERERRDFQHPPTLSSTVPVSDLIAGSSSPPGFSGNPAERNAPSLSEGKMLFASYNCVGCHANGGGGMGPPLMDDEWIYGHRPDQIFKSILEGRPNGMPSFQQRIPDYQIWELAAYVRSMGGLVPKDAAPGRDDHLSGKPPESSTEKMKPSNSSQPAVQ